MEIKYKEYDNKKTDEDDDIDDYNDSKDNLKQLGIDNSSMVEMEEDEYEFEQPDSKALQKIEEEQQQWTPDEQFRLLYSYFKDMSVEPLLTAKEEVSVSAKIKKCESRASYNFV